MDKTNLLKETKRFLKYCEKQPKDIKWIGSEEYGYFTWDDFKKLANKEYDKGYGAQEVAEDLLIVGEDWFMERTEYDGAEGWRFVTIPQQPMEYKKPKRIMGGMWASLDELNP